MHMHKHMHMHMLDVNIEPFASSKTPMRSGSELESDIRAGSSRTRNPRPPEPTTHKEDKPRRAGPWPHDNPRRAAHTPHKKLRLPEPMIQQESRAASPMPHMGPWFKGQVATTHKNHQQPWPAVGHLAPQSHKNLRPTGLPLQHPLRPRWVSSPRCDSANPRPTRKPTPYTPPIWGKRSEQNRVDREAGLPNAPSLAADAPITVGEAPGGGLHADAGLPPGFPFHVRTLPQEQRASTVATSVALPPIVHSGGDAVKSSLGPCGVARGELGIVYTRNSTHGIVLVRR
jgi:hypothetical protein